MASSREIISWSLSWVEPKVHKMRRNIGDILQLKPHALTGWTIREDITHLPEKPNYTLALCVIETQLWRSKLRDVTAGNVVIDQECTVYVRLLLQPPFGVMVIHNCIINILNPQLNWNADYMKDIAEVYSPWIAPAQLAEGLTCTLYSTPLHVTVAQAN